MSRLLGSRHYLFGPFMQGTDTGAGGGLPADDSDIDALSIDDDAKTALRKERTARRDAARKTSETEGKLSTMQAQLDALTQEKADRERADREAAETAATQAGEHERLANQYKGERDKLQTDLTDMTAQRDAYRTATQDMLKTEWDALPEAIRDLYQGDNEDALAKLAYLPKAKKAAEAAGTANGSGNGEGDGTGSTGTGTPPDPKPQGKVPAADAEADARAKAQNRLRYT